MVAVLVVEAVKFVIADSLTAGAKPVMLAAVMPLPAVLLDWLKVSDVFVAVMVVVHTTVVD